MELNPTKPSVLALSLTRFYGASLLHKRQSIQTEMVDQKISGAIVGRNNVIKSRVNMVLRANKAHLNFLHTIQKAANGTLSLQTVFPFLDVSLNRRATALNTVNVYVSTAASSGDYLRTINNGNNASDSAKDKALAFGNGSVAALCRTFTSDRLNGIAFAGDLTTGLIPALHSVWESKLVQTAEETVGQHINLTVLRIWKNIQSTATNTALDEVTRQEKYAEAWKIYSENLQSWISAGYVHQSTVGYAKQNGIQPVTAAFLGTTAANDELNIQKILGTPDGFTSETPDLNEGNFHAIILDDEQDEFGKHHFGIFKLAGMTADNLVTLEDAEDIAKNAEIATRSVQIFDGAGRALKARVRVADQTYGKESKPVKTSRSFFNLPVGTVVHLQGSLSFRTMKEGSQSIVAELEVEEFMSSTTNQNMIIGDISTIDADDEDFDLSSLAVNTQSLGVEPETVTGSDPVLATDTQTDDDMNS